jgi:hypothetical protein
MITVFTEARDVRGEDWAPGAVERPLPRRLDQLRQDQRVVGEVRKLA